jgi:hypothetical protein
MWEKREIWKKRNGNISRRWREKVFISFGLKNGHLIITHTSSHSPTIFVEPRELQEVG